MPTWIRSAYKNVGKGTGGRGRPWKPANINGILVEPQRNNWSCGPVSLRHCMLVFGNDVDVVEIVKLAGSTRAGTDETQLTKAAATLGFKLTSYIRRSPTTLKRLIESKLRIGVPLVACVDRWQHWVAVLHRSRLGFLVLNSSRPGPVVQLWTWKQLERRIRLVYCRRFKQYFNSNLGPIYAVMALCQPVQRRKR